MFHIQLCYCWYSYFYLLTLCFFRRLGLVNFINNLCKDRTGKLCSCLCPKPQLRNSGSRKLLNFIFFFWKLVAFHLYGGLEIALEVVKKVKMLKFEKSGASYKLKFIHADNAVQNILRELKNEANLDRARKVISSFG